MNFPFTSSRHVLLRSRRFEFLRADIIQPRKPVSVHGFADLKHRPRLVRQITDDGGIGAFAHDAHLAWGHTILYLVTGDEAYASGARAEFVIAINRMTDRSDIAPPREGLPTFSDLRASHPAYADIAKATTTY